MIVLVLVCGIGFAAYRLFMLPPPRSNHSRLKRLRLSLTPCTDADMVHVAALTELELLYLNNTKIGDAGLAHLEGLTGLWQLPLNDTKVTDAGLAHLKGM